ncbi:YbaB/EbfC family nucleoid-associated protein [Cryptosporangium sp. NPDC048952]|uniref:YbaB/EbfC family nucleoid-associated protein n=1 Tax=Cryptosporangium sp. NPDC048952 TaxID=3363961 RepID=UPI00371077C1
MTENSRSDRPDWSAVSSMAKDLQSAIGDAERAQNEALRVTGTAWSKDGMVKAVVGARGHLLELDLDPRVYRTPNSKALAATILSTVRAATDDVLQQTGAILDRSVPADLRARASGKGRLDMWKIGRMHDGDLRDELRRKDEADGVG